MAFILNKVTQAMHYNRNGSVTLLQSNSLFDNEERDRDLTILLVAQCFADYLYSEHIFLIKKTYVRFTSYSKCSNWRQILKFGVQFWMFIYFLLFEWGKFNQN